MLQDAPGTPSQLLPCCSRLIEIFPWPDPSAEQNGIYSQSKANQRKRTKVYRPPELLWNEEVGDVWVSSIPLLQSPRCRLPGERLVLMQSFNPLTYERTGFRFRCIYLKTSDPNEVISLWLQPFIRTCVDVFCISGELWVITVCLGNKGSVEWPLQMHMLGFFKALGYKDYKAGLSFSPAFLLCSPLFFAPSERKVQRRIRLCVCLRGK